MPRASWARANTLRRTANANASANAAPDATPRTEAGGSQTHRDTYLEAINCIMGTERAGGREEEIIHDAQLFVVLVLCLVLGAGGLLVRRLVLLVGGPGQLVEL